MRKNKELYANTIRLYTKEDEELIKGLKKEFGMDSMSNCIVKVTKEYYRLKKKHDELLKRLEKAVIKKYEIKSEFVRKDVLRLLEKAFIFAD